MAPLALQDSVTTSSGCLRTLSTPAAHLLTHAAAAQQHPGDNERALGRQHRPRRVFEGLAFPLHRVARKQALILRARGDDRQPLEDASPRRAATHAGCERRSRSRSRGSRSYAPTPWQASRSRAPSSSDRNIRSSKTSSMVAAVSRMLGPPSEAAGRHQSPSAGSGVHRHKSSKRRPRSGRSLLGS